jgi:hypothetical protein
MAQRFRWIRRGRNRVRDWFWDTRVSIFCNNMLGSTSRLACAWFDSKPIRLVECFFPHHRLPPLNRKGVKGEPFWEFRVCFKLKIICGTKSELSKEFKDEKWTFFFGALVHLTMPTNTAKTNFQFFIAKYEFIYEASIKNIVQMKHLQFFTQSILYSTVNFPLCS